MTENLSFSRVGGRLSLDFANTIGSRLAEASNDRLAGYADLLAWGVEAGLVAPGDAKTWAGTPDVALFRQAVDLREAIYRIFSAVAAGRPAAEPDLAVLNGVLEASAFRVRPTGDGYAWTWPRPPRPEHLLWSIAADAGTLLTGSQLPRVGECASEHCGWLFLDESRNGSRRWCDMKDCGNRAKARRHYQRAKG
jgi:predicted RNA-binding Zn ribbon-like protein